MGLATTNVNLSCPIQTTLEEDLDIWPLLDSQLNRSADDNGMVDLGCIWGIKLLAYIIEQASGIRFT